MLSSTDQAVTVQREWRLELPPLAIENFTSDLLAPESGSSLFNYEEVPSCISPSQLADNVDLVVCSFGDSGEDEVKSTFLSHVKANNEGV